MWQVMMLSDLFPATRRIKWSSSCVESLLRTGMSSQHWLQKVAEWLILSHVVSSSDKCSNCCQRNSERFSSLSFEKCAFHMLWMQYSRSRLYLGNCRHSKRWFHDSLLRSLCHQRRFLSFPAVHGKDRIWSYCRSFGLKQVESENTSSSFNISIYNNIIYI